MTGRVVDGLDTVEPSPSVVTIGFFDGVHLGHQASAGRAVALAREAGVRCVAVTFDRHPSEVTAPDHTPPMLMTTQRRIAALSETDVDLTVVLPFTPELAATSAEAFIEEVLVGALQASAVVVGSNFRFGHRAAGDVRLLARWGHDRGLRAETVQLITLDGWPVSSTAIRQALQRGGVEWAARALTRPFVLDGTVVTGDGRGRTIGVPTANVAAGAGLQVPGNGVYAGRLEVATEPGDWLPAVINVGVRPTFDGEGVSVEVHLLDTQRELYGAQVAVAFTDRLRDEQRFDGVDALVAQIHADIDRARALLAAEPGR